MRKYICWGVDFFPFATSMLDIDFLEYTPTTRYIFQIANYSPKFTKVPVTAKEFGIFVLTDFVIL